MKLSVIVPVYNEVHTIETVVERICATSFDTEIVVVDDCSSDGTSEKIASLQKKYPNLVNVKHPSNSGKGAAVRTGCKIATGDVFLIQDADLEYHPKDYPLLLEPIISGNADVVYGSRFVSGQSRRVLYFWHEIGNKMLTYMSNMFTNINLSDMETCYKVFTKEVVSHLTIEENRFGLEPELTAKCAIMGCRIYEVGISYAGRTYQEGKKIGLKDAFRALWCIVKYNVFKRHPYSSVILDWRKKTYDSNGVVHSASFQRKAG